MPFLYFSPFFFIWRAQCSVVAAVSADDTRKSMLLQICLNIFTSAVKLQVYIFLNVINVTNHNILLLGTWPFSCIKPYCGGRASFNTLNAEVMKTGQMDDTDFWKCVTATIWQFLSPHDAQPTPTIPNQRSPRRLSVYMKENQTMEKALRRFDLIFPDVPWWLWMCANWNKWCNYDNEDNLF